MQAKLFDLKQNLFQEQKIFRIGLDQQDPQMHQHLVSRAGGLSHAFGAQLTSDRLSSLGKGLDGSYSRQMPNGSASKLIFLQLAVEGSASDSQQVCGNRPVPFGVFEGIHDGAAFQHVQRNDGSGRLRHKWWLRRRGA
jgi:hypothetical protein